MGVPENVNKNAIPITMPGMVFVTRAMLSITDLSRLLNWLRAVASAAAYATTEPVSAVKMDTRLEFLYTESSLESVNTVFICSVVNCLL